MLPEITFSLMDAKSSARLSVSIAGFLDAMEDFDTGVAGSSILAGIRGELAEGLSLGNSASGMLLESIELTESSLSSAGEGVDVLNIDSNSIIVHFTVFPVRILARKPSFLMTKVTFWRSASSGMAWMAVLRSVVEARSA